jgi:HTH-type transcriptional regulator/antitoxin MqsA
MREICFECEGVAVLTRGERSVRIGQRETSVVGEYMQCTACGEVYFLPGQMQALQKAAATRIREEEGLLAPEEILALREEMGISQASFEILLGVGEKTAGRWERGTVFQSRAVDTLIRTMREMPEVAHFWAEQRGVRLDPAFGRSAYTVAAEAWRSSLGPSDVRSLYEAVEVHGVSRALIHERRGGAPYRTLPAQPPKLLRLTFVDTGPATVELPAAFATNRLEKLGV